MKLSLAAMDIFALAPWSRRARVLTALFALLVPAFAVTAFTTRSYHAEQERLAGETFARGERALGQGHAGEAVTELRTALSLTPTRPRRLRLAQALAADGRVAEARAHLLTLRETAPGDGVINLELARLAARENDIPRATRYYRDAIEGAWQTTPDAQRRSARLELGELLVRQGTPAQAEGELIALAADLPPDPSLHVRLGDLLMAAQLPRRAFDLYTSALRLEPRNIRARQGAAEAAFGLQNYVTARRYYAAVAAVEPGNTYVRGRLETVNAIIGLDPFARGLGSYERARRAALAYDIASRRLAACAEAQGVPLDPGAAGDDLQQFAAEAQVLRRRVRIGPLARDPDLLDQTMDLVFRIEEAADARCGRAAGQDEALVLIARDRRSTER
jgi:tetratricopeptide (TPR) repeat protein